MIVFFFFGFEVLGPSMEALDQNIITNTIKKETNKKYIIRGFSFYYLKTFTLFD